MIKLNRNRYQISTQLIFKSLIQKAMRHTKNYFSCSKRWNKTGRGSGFYTISSNNNWQQKTILPNLKTLLKTTNSRCHWRQLHPNSFLSLANENCQLSQFTHPLRDYRTTIAPTTHRFVWMMKPWRILVKYLKVVLILARLGGLKIRLCRTTFTSQTAAASLLRTTWVCTSCFTRKKSSKSLWMSSPARTTVQIRMRLWFSPVTATNW